MKIDDAFTVILEELEKVDGPTKSTSTNIYIVCPFHEDSDPSLGVNISQEAPVPLGTFNCWSCSESGSWNKLAQKLNLRQIKEWQHFEGTTSADRARFAKKKKERENTNNKSMGRFYEELGGAVIPWPKDKEWRGYPGSMIARVDGCMFSDSKRDDDVMLGLPVYINKRYKGGVKALRQKAENGASYINTSGDWVMNYGLLGYDFIRKHKLFGCKAVVLCEGPRDWLRLVLNKIPACAILGSKMFGERKLMLLQGLGISKIYTLTDNDKAGRAMAKLVGDVVGHQLQFEELKLPRDKDKNGDLIKMDPDAAPQEIIDQVKEIVYAWDQDDTGRFKKEKKKKPKALPGQPKSLEQTTAELLKLVDEFPAFSFEKKTKPKRLK